MVCTALEFDAMTTSGMALIFFGERPASDVDTGMTNLGVHTLGDVQLSFEQRTLLAKGLRYVPVPTRRSIVRQQQDFMTGVRRLHRSIRLAHAFKDQASTRSPFHIKNEAYTPVNEILDPALDRALERAGELSKDTVRETVLHYPRSNLTRSDVSAIRSLRTMPIVIRPADKNLGVTAMSLDWYNAEVQRQLSSDAYCRVSNNGYSNALKFTRALLRKLIGTPGKNTKFSRLAESIDPKLPSFLRRFLDPKSKDKPKIPRFYLLPKLHKTPPKGRPIVASLQWITTPASKALDYLLQPLVTNVAERVLKDTRQLVNIIERLDVAPDAILFTADVESLYTNIPREDCNKAITYWMRKAQQRGQMSKDLPWWKDSLDIDTVISFLHQLTNLVFTRNFFTSGFDDNGDAIVYRQQDGMAMGTQCAPPEANLYMAFKEDVDYDIPARLADGHELQLWLRYIDDVVGIWLGTPASLRAFLNDLNGRTRHGNIRLTHEVSDSAVDFMDLHIYKGPRFQASGRLDLRVHRKRLNRYLYLPWTSAHPKAQKRAFLKGELIRFIRNSSDFEAYLNDLGLFARALRARGYPSAFIRDCFKTVTYSDRPKYLKPSTSKTDNSKPHQVTPFVLVSPHTPLSQRVGQRSVLTLTATEVRAQAAEAAGVESLDHLVDPRRRWIKANTLPGRLGHLLRKSWPPSFSNKK